VAVADFNSYGARRGHHQVMVRGTFANVRLRNLLVPGSEGGVARHQPSGERLPIFDAAQRYAAEGVPLLVFAGQEYGTGSSRDWAAKGTRLLGVRAVVAESFERIHRANLVGMGVLPLQLPAGVAVATLRLDGGETAAGDAVIGADGVHSVIRHELFGGDSPRFFGMIAWRGVIPIERVPRHISRDKATNWIGVGGHVVHYPLRAGKLMNFVGIQERGDWQVESWTTQGTAQECANDHKGWHPDVQALIAAAPSLFKWALMGRDPLPQWTHGNVTLLGDACHPTLPMLAQGAVMAIEDAVILGRCFDKYGDGATALSRYQDARIAVTTRKVVGADDNAKRFHNPALGTEEGATAYVDREWSRDAIIGRYEWIFTYDVDTVDI
jgi:2-polyprenyl-6-methoxyphenol hydroxylase-like FAD-dependent oxidoreductase